MEKKRKYRRRIVPPKERSLIAVFHLNRIDRKVEFKGFAFNATHTSEIMTGDGKYALVIKGVIERRRDWPDKGALKDYYAVKLPLKWDQPLTLHMMVKLPYLAQKLAEVKLGIRRFAKMKDWQMMNDEELMDTLRGAIADVNDPEIIIERDAPKVDGVDVWNRFIEQEEN